MVHHFTKKQYRRRLPKALKNSTRCNSHQKPWATWKIINTACRANFFGTGGRPALSAMGQPVFISFAN